VGAALALVGCASAPSGAPEPKPLAVERHGLPDSRDRSGEAVRLAVAKGVWRRADTLTVDTDEGIQLRFVDAGTCEGFYTCRRWVFGGSVQIRHRSPVAQGKDEVADFWLVEFFSGEGGYSLAIDKESGRSIQLDTEPVISQDKSRWATGDCNEESESPLTIYAADEFARVIPVAVAPDNAPCCEIIGWDGDALKVKLCEIEPGKNFPDRLARQPDGSWRGQHIHLEKPKSPAVSP
jgi:hypothetical protein